MSRYLIVFSSLTLVALLTSPTLHARHAGAHPVHYVAIGGVDEGACEKPKKPCGTIKYALDQAGKGDKIHVAEGEYRVESSDIFYLLSDLVLLTGGYNSQDNFSKKPLASLNTAQTDNQATTQVPVTHIIGIPAEYREELAKKGFHLIQDQKGELTFDVEMAKQLKLYKTLTTNSQPASSCISNMAGSFPCNKFDLEAHMPLSDFSSNPNSANDIWGFVDLNDNNEYALIGLQNGTAVVNVTDSENPVEVGTITGSNNIWRDIKVFQYFDDTAQRYNAYAYVTTEASQGLQVIDLTDLPNSISLANTINSFSSAHNIYIANVDYSTGISNASLSPHLYIAGSNVGGGAFHVLNLDDPTNPQLETSSPTGAGYIHDATSMVISDSRTSQCAAGHNPCEILIDYNESTVDLWDITDATTPFKISSTGYSGSGYVHSGWWSDDKRYIFIQDELDEQRFGINSTLRVMDINDLTQPQLVGSYVGPTKAIDHNGFVKGNRYYMSNYRRGLTVLSIANPASPKEFGYFDTFPAPSSNSANFNGAWGVYPYLPSGNIIVSDIEFGLFVISESPADTTPPVDPPPVDPPPVDPPPTDPPPVDPPAVEPPVQTPPSSSGGGSIGFLVFLLAGLGRLRKKVVL